MGLSVNCASIKQEVVILGTWSPLATPKAGKPDPGIHNSMKIMDSRLITSGQQ